MRKLFAFGLAILLAAVLAAPANAAKYIRQNADGTASWINTRDNTITPAGEHAYTVLLSAIGTAATVYVIIPHAGRLKSVHAFIDAAIATATEEIDFWIASTATAGAPANQFVAVTPAIAEAATAAYQLQIPLAYAATGDIVSTTWPVNSNTSLDIVANGVIAIHTLGYSVNSEADAWITIVVH